MTVIWQINLEHQDSDYEAIDRCAASILQDFNICEGCRPRLIQLAVNGPGQLVGEILIAKGLPVALLSPAHWRQEVIPELCGPAVEGETCL